MKRVQLIAADQDLMSRFVSKQDRSAFEELVRRWDRPILAFLIKACGSPEDAQDMRQEVFLRLYRYGATYNPRSAFSTWLFRIAVNVMKTWKAKKGNLQSESEPLDGLDSSPVLMDLSPNPRERAGEAELEHQTQSAMARLSIEERQLLFLRLNQELSYRQIAEIEGAPETTIKSRFYTALERLRKTLSASTLAIDCGFDSRNRRSC
ncbi:MAG: sigma-70 family RNA polymerase sigma factor [Syntrophaceae bacterium]|nr:sigma-70 family RNA polymerase sigma factor [Syntrophaceae bacterium]